VAALCALPHLSLRIHLTEPLSILEGVQGLVMAIVRWGQGGLKCKGKIADQLMHSMLKSENFFKRMERTPDRGR
jgi:hypothetical protein